MCGIIGYLGTRPAAPILCRGIDLVQYRGYDSAGAAILENGQFVVRKFAGDPKLTIEAIQSLELTGTLGLAHTRWATHGGVLDKNAHPHFDCSGQIAVAHNGMLWNDAKLRQELEQRGHRFSSDTDTEVMAHFIESLRARDFSLLEAVRVMAYELQGSTFAMVAVDATLPDELVGACQGGELYVGVADHGLFLASDHRAFREHTSHYIKVDTGMIVRLSRGQLSPEISTFDKVVVDSQVEELWYEINQLTKGDYAHFMLAEIMQQSTTLQNALDGRVRGQEIHIGGLERQPRCRNFIKHGLRRVLLVACGTSNYAADAAARLFKSLGFDAISLNAGEFVSSPEPVGPDTLVVPVSQSGTTKETIMAAQRATDAAARVFPIVNVPGSAISRFGCGSGMYVQAGLETAVASTKAFTGQILNAALLGYAMAQIKGLVTPTQLADFCDQASQLPGIVKRILFQAQAYIDLGASLATAELFLYLGKGYGMAVAQEGALKLKEVAYKPAFGLSASDLKHGPLAMLNGQTVVVAVCLPDEDHPEVYEWTVSNVKQVLSREGRVIVVCHDDDQLAPNLEASGNQVMSVIRVPPTKGIFTAITSVIPLQLFAYGLALEMSKTHNDVKIDKPRHIAKVATVL